LIDRVAQPLLDLDALANEHVRAIADISASHVPDQQEPQEWTARGLSASAVDECSVGSEKWLRGWDEVNPDRAVRRGGVIPSLREAYAVVEDIVCYLA
jgi:hypothetical protein